MKFPYPRTHAFTLIELLATIAILAVLTVMAIGFIGNYVTWARTTADQQTFTVLSAALQRYKTQGGNLPALTEDAPISNILALLSAPVSWQGMTHQFIKEGETYNASSLSALGNRQYYRFTGYGSYQSEEALSGATSPTGAALPDGVGRITAASSKTFNVYVATSSGWVCFQSQEGDKYYYPVATAWNSPTYITGITASTAYSFWSCAGDGLDTKAGNIIAFEGTNNQLTSANVNSLTSLQYLGLSNNQIKQLAVSNLSALMNFDCADNQITSLSLRGLTSLLVFTCRNNQISSLDLSPSTLMYYISCENNRLSSLNIGSLTDIYSLNCNNNQLSSLNLSTLSALINLYCSDNRLTSIDAHNSPLLVSIEARNNRISSINTTGCIGLEVLFLDNNLLSSIPADTLDPLYDLEIGFNPISSIDLSSILANLTSLSINIALCDASILSDMPGTLYLCVNPADVNIDPTFSRTVTLKTAANFTPEQITNYLGALPATNMGHTVEVNQTQHYYWEYEEFSNAVDAASANGWNISI